MHIHAGLVNRSSWSTVSDFTLKCVHIRLVLHSSWGCLRADFELFWSRIVPYWVNLVCDREISNCSSSHNLKCPCQCCLKCGYAFCICYSGLTLFFVRWDVEVHHSAELIPLLIDGVYLLIIYMNCSPPQPHLDSSFSQELFEMSANPVQINSAKVCILGAFSFIRQCIQIHYFFSGSISAFMWAQLVS